MAEVEQMKPIEQRIYEGNRAQEVLENEVFQQVFADIEQEYTEAWKNSPARDAEGREKLWTYISLIRKLKAQMVTTMETGKLAKLDLEHQRKIQDRLRDGWRSLTE